MNLEYYLPIIFLCLLGISILIYVLLDGFDLGVGMLLPRTNQADEQDTMVKTITPFWDANETWVVLTAGILFIAFPKANTLIMGNLYLPVTLMLIALILRGAAFDFRHHDQNKLWNVAFMVGSTITALSQGWMLGRFLTAFGQNPSDYLFALGTMFTVPAVYVLLAACWLLAKTQGSLRDKAITWANQAWYPVVICLILISITTPYISDRIYERWFSDNHLLYLSPLPLLTAYCLIRCKYHLKHTLNNDWQAFKLVVLSLLLCAIGLGISLFPDILIDQMTIWEASADHYSLITVLIGAGITIPCIIAYSAFSYWIFRGKVHQDIH